MKSIFITLMIAIAGLLPAHAQRIGRWEKLGETIVEGRTDKDVIRCSHKGYFTKLKFNVKDNDVEFKKVIVRFANGQTQTLNVKGRIRAGGETHVIDLKGNRRVIREITFYYKTVNSGKGHNDRHNNTRHKCHDNRRQARVSVWGRH